MLFPFNILRQYYLRRYAPRFRHAKKLFLFDLVLLGSTGVFALATLVYLLYTPAETPRAEVVIQLPEGRITSGAETVFQFTISRPKNGALKEAHIVTTYPKGFSVSEVQLNGERISPTSTAYRFDFSSTGTVRVVVAGQYVGAIGQEDAIIVRVHDPLTGLFLGAARASVFGRDSVVRGQITVPARGVQGGQSSLTLSLVNEHKIQRYDISVPLSLPEGLTLKNVRVSRGSVERGVWRIGQLSSQEKISARILVETSFRVNKAELRGQFVPEVVVGGKGFPQTPVSFEIKKSFASIVTDARWEKVESVTPGTRAPLTVTVKNNGKEAVQNVTLDVLFDETVVDAPALIRSYGGSKRISGGVEIPLDRVSFLPGEEEVRPLTIPVRLDTTADTVTLQLIARAVLSEGESDVLGSAQAVALPIGTSFTAEGEVRYFTSEGDQLGRGPLPPRVGETTKYWVIVTAKNGRGVAEKPLVRVILPESVSATGQSSVTRGDVPVFSSGNRIVTWQGGTLQQFQTAEVAFEISYTPRPAHIGAIATLVENIQVTAYDPITKQTLAHTINKGLTSALPRDIQGQALGGIVTREE